MRWIGIVLFILIPVARWSIFETDHQMANLASMGLGLLGTIFLYVGSWFWLARKTIHHLLFFFAPIVAATLFFLNFRFVGFTGETLPVFRSRWSKIQESAPSHIASEKQTKRKMDGAIPDSDSAESLQFLGNDRNGICRSSTLDTNWTQNQPRVLWKHPIGAGWSGFAVRNGLAVTLEQVDQLECLSAYDLLEGRLVWQAKFPGRHFDPFGGLGPRSTPSIGGEFVYAQTALGIVCCVELQSGKIVWQKDLLQSSQLDQATSEKSITWGRSGSPLIIGDQLILPFGGKTGDPSLKTLISLDLKTGNELWRNGDEQISYASPVLMKLIGVPQIVSVNENCVTGHNPYTGATLWRTQWPSNSNADACASQPVQVSDQRILLGKGYALGSKVFELSFSGSDSDVYNKTHWVAKDVWSNPRVVKTKFTSGLFFEGYIYALSDGILECVDPKDGRRVWRGARYGQGQAIIVNGTVVVSAEDGRVAFVNASPDSHGKSIMEMEVLEGITWNVPTVAGSYLLVRNGEQVACLGLGKDAERDVKESLQ